MGCNSMVWAIQGSSIQTIISALNAMKIQKLLKLYSICHINKMNKDISVWKNILSCISWTDHQTSKWQKKVLEVLGISIIYNFRCRCWWLNLTQTWYIMIKGTGNHPSKTLVEKKEQKRALLKVRRAFPLPLPYYFQQMKYVIIRMHTLHFCM